MYARQMRFLIPTIIALSLFSCASNSVGRGSDESWMYHGVDKDGKSDDSPYGANYDENEWRKINPYKSLVKQGCAITKCGWFRKEFHISKSRTGKYYLITGGVDGAASIFVNGRRIEKDKVFNGKQFIGKTISELDISDFIVEEANNVFCFKVIQKNTSNGIRLFWPVSISDISEKIDITGGFKCATNPGETTFDCEKVQKPDPAQYPWRQISFGEKGGNLFSTVGCIWYDRNIVIPAAWRKSRVVLHLTQIVGDFDIIVNNKLVKRFYGAVHDSIQADISSHIDWEARTFDLSIRVQSRIKPGGINSPPIFIIHVPNTEFSVSYLAYIEPRTGIAITTGKYYDLFQDESDILVGPIDKNRFVERIEIIKEELGKYPSRILQNTVCTIKLVSHIYDISDHGYWGGRSEGSTIVLEIGDYYTSIDILHHEIAHSIYSLYDDQFNKNGWLAVNPPGFKYSHNPAKFLQQGERSVEKKRNYLPSGFLSPYSEVDLREDIAVMSEHVFCGKNDFWVLVNDYDKINSKYRIFLDFFHSLDARYTDQYFRSFRKSSL